MDQQLFANYLIATVDGKIIRCGNHNINLHSKKYLNKALQLIYMVTVYAISMLAFFNFW